MSYKIINYYEEYGELEILFEETDNTFNVIIPIVNGSFVTGDSLAQVLSSFQSVSKTEERKTSVSTVDNIDDIKALVNEDDCKISVRKRRKKLLLDSDYTQFADSPLPETKKELWATYRQQLRDISLQEGFPLNIIWPTLPI